MVFRGLFGVIVLLFIFGNVQSQDTASYQKLDTFIFYDVAAHGPYYNFARNSDTCKYPYFTSRRGKDETVRYYINCKEVTEGAFKVVADANLQLSKCKPCLMEYYSENDTLLRVIEQYLDCYVGLYREYYPNGKVKVLGQYKVNYTGKWRRLYKRGYCSVRVGKWIYYKRDGTIERTEQY